MARPLPWTSNDVRRPPRHRRPGLRAPRAPPPTVPVMPEKCAEWPSKRTGPARPRRRAGSRARAGPRPFHVQRPLHHGYAARAGDRRRSTRAAPRPRSSVRTRRERAQVRAAAHGEVEGAVRPRGSAVPATARSVPSPESSRRRTSRAPSAEPQMQGVAVLHRIVRARTGAGRAASASAVSARGVASGPRSRSPARGHDADRRGEAGTRRARTGPGWSRSAVSRRSDS